MDPQHLTRQIRAEAWRQGFQLVGVCPAVQPAGYHNLLKWLECGYGGEMHYLSARVDAYEHPNHVLTGVRSIVMLGMNYHTQQRRAARAGQGSVASYAWGELDYHDLIHERLKQLCQLVIAIVPDAKVRGVVDTAPLLEREFAQLAGLGWVGKNTLLLNKKLGSYFFLAALLTDQTMTYDEAFHANHCGSCRACLDACPTDAFPQPYVLDATRCISYLTIELRQPIPVDLRGRWDDWLFGCDVCQEVCPWNQGAPIAAEPSYQPRTDSNPMALAELFFLDEEQFRARFRPTPLWRAKRRGILRNAALVLGSQRATNSIPALTRGLSDPEELVRGACAWALDQIKAGPP